VNYIVDDIGVVVENLSSGRYWAKEFDQFFRGNPCQYLYGHRLQINNQLLRQQQNPAKKEQRYPLIALFLDIEEPVINGVINYKLNLVIGAKTDPNYSTEARYQDNKPFKSVLYPLYYAFMQSLSDSGLFMWPGVADMPKHSKIDRPFWGVSIADELGVKKNEANIFNDFLDAIQIKNLEINQKLKTC